MLAIFAELAKARLALNEIAETRAGLLGRLFRDVAVTRHNAEQIHDRLDPAIRPSVVLMNPPFSASPTCRGPLCRSRDPPYRLGAGAARRGRTARRDHRPQCRSRSAGLARGLRAAAGEGPRRLHRDDRGQGLCPPRYEHGNAADGDRPRSGRGSARFSVLARHGRRCRRIARPGVPPGAAAAAGDRGFPPARPRRVSGTTRRYGRKLPPAAHPPQTPGADAGFRRTRL